MWRTRDPPLSALRWRVERVSRADERGVADGRHGEVYGVERLRDEREGERSWSPVERRRWCVCASGKSVMIDFKSVVRAVLAWV